MKATYEQVSCITLSFPEYPDAKLRLCDIVACNAIQCLYVAHFDENSTSLTGYLMSVEPSKKSVIRWPPENRESAAAAADPKVDLRPRSVSVRSGRLLVVSDPRLLLLFGPDGDELRRVRLDGDTFGCVNHALEMPDDKLILCHYLLISEESRKPDSTSAKPTTVRCSISEIQLNGDCGKYITKRTSDYSSQLQNPAYMSMYSEDVIIVADSDSNRVLAFGRNLDLKGVLMDRARHKIFLPNRMCYVPQSNHLAVACHVRNWIIFDIPIMTPLNSPLRRNCHDINML